MGVPIMRIIRRPWGACWMVSVTEMALFGPRPGPKALEAPAPSPGPQAPANPGPRPRSLAWFCFEKRHLFRGPDTLRQTWLLAPLHLLQDSQVSAGVVVVLANYKGILIVLFWFRQVTEKSYPLARVRSCYLTSHS